MSIQEIKARGREAFRANYWRCVVAALLLALLLGATAGSARTQAADTAADGQAAVTMDVTEQDLTELMEIMTEEELGQLGLVLISGLLLTTVIGAILKIFVWNPLKVGCYRFFVKNVQEPGASLGVIKEGFGGYLHTMITLFLTDLFLLLWTLLCLIPGLVKAYSYRLVPYILKEQPELSATEAISRSREMMQGNKMRAFLLDLSFLGWILLGALTFGLVQVFWTGPYRESANAAFYLDVKASQ